MYSLARMEDINFPASLKWWLISHEKKNINVNINGCFIGYRDWLETVYKHNKSWSSILCMH